MESAFAVGSLPSSTPAVVVTVPHNVQAPAAWPQRQAVKSTTSCQLAGGLAAAGCAWALAGSKQHRAGRSRAVACSAFGTVTMGQRVQWHGNAGVVKFMGKVSFAPGEWVGIELDEPKGMHDGTVFNDSYFTCPPKHGVFCTPADLGASAPASPAASAPSPAAAAAASPMPAAAAVSGGTAAVGQKVTWKGSTGTVRFVGKTGFAAEEMVGIELDGPQGMHNGSLFGVSYFSCMDKHGVFCKASELGGGGASAAPAPSQVPINAPTTTAAAAVSPAGSFSVGQAVTWKGQPGTVQFVGKVDFAAEEMIGVQLNSPAGMHNGSLFGKTYFSCPDKHGVFCKASDLA